MIRLLEEVSTDRLQELKEFCEPGCFGVKAIGPLLSYGTKFDFVMAWEQRREDGTLTAFLTKYYGSVTLCTADDTAASPVSLTEDEREELTEFLEVIGYSALCGAPAVLEPLVLAAMTGDAPSFDAASVSLHKGLVMEYARGEDCTAVAPELPDGMEYLVGGALDDFYDTLTKNFPEYLAVDFGDWAVDFAYRLRHKTASSALLAEGDRGIATAAALVLTDHAMLLGAVSTDEAFRGRHYASGCIRTLCDKFPDKRVFLMCDPDKQGFYEGLGMKVTGSFWEVGPIRK